MFKRFKCTHNWRLVSAPFTGKETYGCTICGKTKKIHGYEVPVWRFKQSFRGETFE